MDARTDRRLGIHASALLVVYGERRSTLFHGGAHDVVSSRTPYLHATQWGAHDVWSHPVRRAVFPRHHDPMRVSTMSGLVSCVAVSPPAVPTPTSGAHQECFFPQRRACVEVIPGSSVTRVMVIA